jgi:hypothetical protein
VAHLVLSFWLLPSSGEIRISGYFLGVAGLQKYYILMVLFSSRIMTPGVNSPIIIKHAK